MENALIILHADDIHPAEQLAATMEEYEVYLFDPVLVDRLASSDLKRFELVTWDDAPSYSSLYNEAHQQAYALEKEIDAARHGILPEVSVYCWQHLNLYYLFMSIQWYNRLWNTLGMRFNDKKLHIFISDNPAVFHFNSFIPALCLLQFARRHEIEFAGYTYGAKSDNLLIADQVPDLHGRCLDDHKEFILTHLPTCMYDMPYFNSEMRASGKAVINLEGKYFSMPVQADTEIGLVASSSFETEIPSSLRQRIEAFLTAAGARLDAYFERTLATTSFRERQVSLFINNYRSQLLTYFLLTRYFSQKNPSRILLSDHDTGLHGPLLAYAEQQHIRVLILPHSKTSPDLEFAYNNMHALVHPAQGDYILDRNQRRIPHFKLAMPTTLQTTVHFPNPIKKVGLMLNAFALNGIYYANYRQYIAGIRKIAAFCDEHKLELLVRCKPSYSVIQLLARECELDLAKLYEHTKSTMADYSENCDICIMYDTPTAGGLEFLARSIPILNPVLAPLTRHQTVTTPPKVIARETLEETLQRLASIHADTTMLQQLKLQQFCSYTQAFADAQPLRVFL